MPNSPEIPGAGLERATHGAPPQHQSQSQAQTQSIEISVGSAGDLELESRIFRDVHSVGRQLARVSNALSVVIGRLELDPELPSVGDPATALKDFRQMREDIRRELEERDDRLISALEKIRDEDPDRYAKVAPRLRALLDGAPPARGNGAETPSRP